MRHAWHPSKSPLFAIYKGMNVLYWPSIINYQLHRLIVSYTDPVHSFIISKHTVEPTGSSFILDYDSMCSEMDFSPEKSFLSNCNGPGTSMRHSIYYKYTFFELLLPPSDFLCMPQIHFTICLTLTVTFVFRKVELILCWFWEIQKDISLRSYKYYLLGHIRKIATYVNSLK